MSEDPTQDVDVARRLARIWRGGADRAAGSGIGEAEIGKSLVAIGLERWLTAEPAGLVAAHLRQLAGEIDGSAPSTGEGSPTLQ